MKAKNSLAWLKAAFLILIVLCMVLVCHLAYSPYNILPSWLKYTVYPVAGDSLVQPLEKGDLAICVKNAEIGAGWPVKYVYHPLSSTYIAHGALFGYMLEHSGQEGTVFDRYRVQVNVGNQLITLNSKHPELVIYRIKWVGGAVLWLNAYRHQVLIGSIGAAVAFTAAAFITARPRRLKRSREMYLKMFESFAQQFENEAEDF